MSDAPASPDPLAPGTTVTVSGGPYPERIGLTATVVAPEVAHLAVNDDEIVLLIDGDPLVAELIPPVERTFSAVMQRSDVTAG